METAQSALHNSKGLAMRRVRTVLLAALLSTAALPAYADWQRMASIDVSAPQRHEFSMEEFKGNVIALTAQGSDVMCDRVTAVFADGDKRPLFRGVMPRGLSIRVDLPPGIVNRVTFNCHPVNGGEGRVDIAADTGVISGAMHG
jgi:hypothetical protein